MQASWNVILNALLLFGVILVITRLVQSRRDGVKRTMDRHEPLIETLLEENDDIIAVRRINPDEHEKEPEHQSLSEQSISGEQQLSDQPETIMVVLLAKDERLLVGYELLQSVLAAGFRFGEGHLFHRHQHANGQGPILFSLAAATPSGTFDLQNIGALSVRGLYLFMETSGSPMIDKDRFDTMLSTAKQLQDDLDAHLLDDKRQLFSEDSVYHYYRTLRVDKEQPVVV